MRVACRVQRLSGPSGCGSAALAELGPQTRHQLRLAVSQPLQPGQRVEIGLQEASVLRSALLVYITPLVGLLGGGGGGQLWLDRTAPARSVR